MHRKLLDCSVCVNKKVTNNMMDTLKLFLTTHLKRHPTQIGGFTLIELLVGMILAGLVITPLMSFMTNILDTSRREEAKATSEQEVQSAVDYIAQDLKQAVYIYNAAGLNNNNLNTYPGISGIKNQIPPEALVPGCTNNPPNDICLPVLVFWKRDIREVVSRGATTNNTFDTFVYSLVAYYLIKGNDPDETWSKAARLGRFQITDAVKEPTNVDIYIEARSAGFQRFDLRTPGITLEEKMNRWQKKPDETYTTTVDTLVDYIDTSSLNPNCPTATQPNIQQVPANLGGGFSACVNSSNTSAQIYLRGNALARIEAGSNCVKQSYPEGNRQSNYCPTTSIQIQGRGLLNAN